MARGKFGYPGIYNSSAITLDDGEGGALAVDVNGNVIISSGGVFATVLDETAGAVKVISATQSTVSVGEIAGSATAAVMPTVSCKMVKFKAVLSNAGNVYIGGSGVTKVDGTTDTTTGIELAPGDETGWLPVSNLNVFYRICDNAGDDLTYLALS